MQRGELDPPSRPPLLIFERMKGNRRYDTPLVCSPTGFKCLTAEDPYQGMGLAITTERLSVCAAGSMVSMRIALPVGTWVHFPTREAMPCIPVALHDDPLCCERYSTVCQSSAVAGLLPSGLNDFVYFAGLPPVTIPFLAIVDDDEALCSSLVDLMCSVGYRAEAFASAETFLMSPNRFSLDCIIADVHMPGMGGLNLLRELHKQRIMTPVILVTALPDEHLDEEAASRGALCLLRKPFETSRLLDRIERSLPK